MKQRIAIALTGVALLLLAARIAETKQHADIYVRHNLVSDLHAHAEHLDPKLVNPWGIATAPGGPFWISDNGTGVSTVYDTDGRGFPHGSPLVVTIPPPKGGMPPAAPTGIVFNGTASFALNTGNPAFFIFATEDGTISGWNPKVDPQNAILKVDNSSSGAVYKGLATGNNGKGDLLYATNFHAGTIDVFDSTFSPATLSGTFSDPMVPAHFAPFGIENIGGKLYVTYAVQDAAAHDDVAGPGNGLIDVFDTNGNLLERLVTGGVLNSPWGLALAPAGFGDLGGTLLVGNFGDGTIHGFHPATGALVGQIRIPSGRPLVIQGLWGLIFGNGGSGGDLGVLYFTAGIPGPGNVEDHGLFGFIRPQHHDGDDRD